MKEIKLTKGKVALVDDENFDYLNQWKWQAVKRKKRYTYYATTNLGGTTIYMHRIILGLVDKKITADHLDHNGLNNQFQNLREATFSQNNCNTQPRHNSSSIYKGVSWDKITKKWRVRIHLGGITKRLGRFVNEKEAAIAYNKVAKELHGKFACLNKVA